MDFIYTAPTKVYFGNKLHLLGEELNRHGKKVLLTYGGGSVKKSGLYERVVKAVKAANLQLFELSGIEPNPRIESVRAGAELCKREGIDVILAVGGGSTIDASKYMAAGAKVDFDPWLFFTEKKPIYDALPVVAVLTLAATGSEMNGGGVITNLKTHEKLGRMCDILRPKASFLDPEITYTVSAYQTACGSADILSHIMETYFTKDNDLEMLDGVMECLMRTVIKYAPIAMEKPSDYEARANLMWTSSWAINGFITGGKTHSWSVHAMEHELSAFYDITHGLGLAILTPRWLEYCLDKDTAKRCKKFAVKVFGVDESLDEREAALRGIEKLKEFLFKTLKLESTLSGLDIDETHFKEMAKKACGGKEIRGFKTLTPADVERIFRACL